VRVRKMEPANQRVYCLQPSICTRASRVGSFPMPNLAASFVENSFVVLQPNFARGILFERMPQRLVLHAHSIGSYS
jgi:hypothetical protein